MCRGPTMWGAGFTGSSTGTIFQPSRTCGGNTASAAGPRRSITSMGATSLLRTASRSFPQRRTVRSEEHTSELQSHHDLVCRLLLEKKKKKKQKQEEII